MGTINQPVSSTASDTTNKPPQLPDTSTWVRRAPGDVIEAGTPYVYKAKSSESFSYNAPSDHDRHAVAPGTYWTPPPVEPAPWTVISTDRERPTDAYVNGVPGRYWRAGRALWMIAEDGNHYCLPDLKPGTDVELLHTYSPATERVVPIEDER